MAEKGISKIDEKELEYAKDEARTIEMEYIHKLAKPFTYEDKTLDELTFDWGKLTGNDSLAIENEMTSMGKVLITPEFSGEYLLRLATRACNQNVSSDFISALPLPDFNKIRGKARSFLLHSA